jgi:hypothetical protein
MQFFAIAFLYTYTSKNKEKCNFLQLQYTLTLSKYLFLIIKRWKNGKFINFLFGGIFCRTIFAYILEVLHEVLYIKIVHKKLHYKCMFLIQQNPYL